MSEDNENSLEAGSDSEHFGFDPSELAKCDKCSQENAPDRRTCIYCGNSLPVAEMYRSRVKLPVNDLEPDVSGWNLIARAREVAAKADSSVLASLDFEVQENDVLAASNALIPLARFASKDDAELAKSRVNISTAIVSDEEFHSTLPSRRISKIAIAGDDLVLTDFNRNENIERRIEDLSAVVLGLLRSFRTTTFEKRGIGKRSTVTDETSDGRDAFILDLHFRSDAVPFTVHSTGFDFSMLGTERSMIVSENFDKLFFRLCGLAPRALVVKDHDRLRNHLRGPWPETVRTDGLGRVQTGFAQRRYGRSSSLDNTLQFTKFSRLQALELDEL